METRTQFSHQFREVQRGGETRIAVRYVPALDGMRAVAVLAVMLVHSGATFGHGGWIGVDLFFVLSGFLITSVLLAEWRTGERIDFRAFYARRFLRLIPALVVFVLGTTAAALLLSRERTATETIQSALASLFYVSNWASALEWVEMGPFEHTWSLAIEEQFYLLWPPLLALLLLKVKRIPVIVATLVALVAASAITRALIFANVGREHPWRTYAGFDTRADSLLIGCLLAMGMATGAVRLPGGLVRGAGWAAFAIVIAMVAALTVDDAFGAFFNYGGYTLFAVVAAVLIGSLVLEETGPLVAFLTLPVMVWIGRISYALYLWHLPIFRRIQDDPTTLAILACVVASFTMATLSWYFVERPCLRLKDRITSTPRASRRRALAGTRRMSES